MNPPFDKADIAAFAIYRTFIAGGIGTRKQKRDHQGRPLWTVGPDGRRAPLIETPDEAAERRWFTAPEGTRDQFRREAIAAICAWEQAA